MTDDPRSLLERGAGPPPVADLCAMWSAGRRRRRVRRVVPLVLAVLAVGAATTVALVVRPDDAARQTVTAGTPTTAARRPVPTTRPLNVSNAVWDVDPHDPPRSTARSFLARVTNAACASGRRAHPPEPEVTITPNEIRVRFTDVPLPSDPVVSTCQAGPSTPFLVHLPVPLDGRPLVDDGCRVDSSIKASSWCRDSGVRWRSASIATSGASAVLSFSPVQSGTPGSCDDRPPAEPGVFSRSGIGAPGCYSLSAMARAQAVTARAVRSGDGEHWSILVTLSEADRLAVADLICPRNSRCDRSTSFRLLALLGEEVVANLSPDEAVSGTLTLTGPFSRGEAEGWAVALVP